MNNNTFPETLSTLRKQKLLSQKAFSDVLGIAQSTYALYETGKREPSIDTLCKIADYFNVSVDVLIGRLPTRQEDIDSLAGKLRLARKRLRKTQDEVSHEVKIARASISNYEIGMRVPDADVLRTLAIYYNVSSDWLLCLSDTPQQGGKP